MKARFVLLALLLLFPLQSFAGRAASLKGIYPVTSVQNGVMADEPQEFFLLDAGTLGEIWSRYSTEPLPADLEAVKNEDTVITALINRKLIFLTLEKTAIVGDNFLSIHATGKQMELRRAVDGNSSDLAVVEGSAIALYKLGKSVPLSARTLIQLH